MQSGMQFEGEYCVSSPEEILKKRDRLPNSFERFLALAFINAHSHLHFGKHEQKATSHHSPPRIFTILRTKFFHITLLDFYYSQVLVLWPMGSIQTQYRR